MAVNSCDITRDVPGDDTAVPVACRILGVMIVHLEIILYAREPRARAIARRGGGYRYPKPSMC